MESPPKPFNHCLKAHQKQIRPKDKPSSSPVDYHAMTMSQELVHLQENGTLHIDPLTLYHLHFHVINVKTLVLDIVIVLENLLLTKIHQVQVTLQFITNEETVDLLTTHLSEIIAILHFLNLTLEVDNTFKIANLHINLQQDHVQHMRLHLENLFVIYNQIPLKNMTTTPDFFFKLKDKFEVIMHTTKTTNAITSTSRCYNLYIYSQNETYSNSPSRLEIVSLLDSGACFMVFNTPNYMIITQIFNVCTLDQQETSKTLTVANDSEIPKKQFIYVPSF